MTCNNKKLLFLRKIKCTMPNKKVYNISITGWIYAPFLEKGAYINELAVSLKQRHPKLETH